MTPDVQAKLYKEADARFQAQTGVVRKLDPKNPLDQKLIPVWANVYGKVLAQWKAGTITWTFEHPAVVQSLNDAAASTAAAVASMNAAAGAMADNSPHEAYGHLQDAGAHQAAAQASTSAAAAVQPPTVSPAHVQHAAHEITQFVMGADGRGVPVSSGHDVVGAMQATSAPVKVALDTGVPPEQMSMSDVLPPKHHLGIGEYAGIGAAVLATVGLVAFAAKGQSSISGRPSYGPRRRMQRGGMR